MRTYFQTLFAALLITAACGAANAGSPLKPGFTYQGSLKQGGEPYTGKAELTFVLFDAATGGRDYGRQLGEVDVVDGLFTVILNDESQFDLRAFNSQALWLEIEVNRTRLTPRQPLTTAPYALQTRGIFVNKELHVGIGTVEPKAELDVNGTTRTKILQIAGGADIAEPFDVTPREAVSPAPGMVVSIDPRQAGKLTLSGEAYDRKVAGIISGANGINAGLTLAQEGTIAEGEHPVALTGRVYCYVDADAAGAIEPGDLLTTSPTPGHAMKVTDHDRAPGAVLGKAMTSLKSGKGLVLVLVNLQ
jgi:hypothetical protein